MNANGPRENFEERLIHLKDLKAFVYLLKYGKGDKNLFFSAISFLFFSSLTGVISARILGELAQTIKTSSLDASYKWGLAIIALEISSIVLLYFGRRWLAKASLNSILRIRQALFTHIQCLPMKFFDTQPQGRIVTRITHDVDTMESFFTSTLARLSNAIITFVVVFCTMIIVNWQIGLIITASMIPVFVITYIIRQPVRKWNREFSIRNSMINAKLSEFLNGIPVIRAFGVEDWSKREFDSVVNYHLHSAIQINRLNSWSRPLIMVLTSLPLAFFIGFGGIAVINNTIDIAVFVTFIRLAERFLQPMSVISQEMHVVQTSLINTERVASFLHNPSEEKVLGKNGSIQADSIQGSIKFDCVDMSYERAKRVLKNVSFNVTAGEKIGLVGRTGSGKTTALALLSRLYEFQSGQILIDNEDIRNFDRDSLRERIGVVNQDSIVFEASLRDNILAGSNLSDEQVQKACEETGLADIMRSNQLNLDSIIYDQGSNLSAGERQLLSLTRILLKNPSILVLDEATANIDPKIEKLIQKAIEKLLVGRTCLIIAHRLETLKHCDRIFVFKSGELIEEGKAVVLENTVGSYYRELILSAKRQEDGQELLNS